MERALSTRIISNGMKQQENPATRIFVGEDRKRSRDALHRVLEAVKAKDPNALVSRFDDVSFDPVFLREALFNQSIFGGENIVVIDGILDHEGGEEFYLTEGNFTDIPNLLFICETAPKKEIRALFKKIGSIEEFPLLKTEERRNDFAVADAVAMRDRRSAWVELCKLKRSGAAMEEVHGMIFWAVKTLYMCATQKREEVMKTGMKEYTYRTYQPRTKKFLVSELEEKLAALKTMYHRAHHGDQDLGLCLEKFLLKL